MTAPEQTRITGDLEVAAKIRTPTGELEKRYSAWGIIQAGAHPIQATFGAFGMADIQCKVERARKRILTRA